MRLIYKVLLIIGTFIFPLLTFLILPVIIFNKSWRWFWIPALIEGIIGLIIGIYFFVVFLRKKEPIKPKLDINQAKNRATYEMCMDEHNPDNFIVDKYTRSNVGKEGYPMTPVLTLEGRGTETNTARYVIYNMNNPEIEGSMLIDPIAEELREAKMKTAENPSEEIREEIQRGTDPRTGLPIVTTRIIRPTKAEIEKREEEKKKEETTGI